MSLISLKPREGQLWHATLSLDEASRAILSEATLEDMTFDTEQSRLAVTLLLPAVPDDASSFDALRKALAAESRQPRLSIRYTPHSLTAAEYLALHFGDLSQRLLDELGSEATWSGELDYETSADGRVTLLAENALFVERLRSKKLPARFAELIQWGCGEKMNVEVAIGEFPDKAPQPQDGPVGTAGTPAPAQVSTKAPEARAGADIPAVPTYTLAVGATHASPGVGQGTETILAGRKIPADKIRHVSSIVEEERMLAIEGRVFAIEEVALKTGRVKLKFAISDGTDSLLCVLWLKEAKDRPKGIANGISARARGDVKPDKYEKDELVMEVADLTLLPKRPGRADTAAQKRVELHAHTKMSAADAVVDPALYVKRAAEWGHKAVGITDHGVVHAFPEAAKAAKKAGIKLLLGMEAYLCPDVSFLENKGKEKKLNASPYFHAILYAKNEIGRRNLYDLVTHSHVETFYKKPLVPKDLLAAKREGLIIGSACEQGELISAMVKGAGDIELEQLAAFYDYLEVQPLGNNAFMLKNGMVSGEEGLKDIVRKVVAIGKKLGKPVVAASDMHFLDPEDEIYRRIMQSGNGFSDAEQQPPLYFHTTDEMLQEFAWLEDEKLVHELVVENPQKVADWCDSVPPVPEGRFFPELAGSEENVKGICQARAEELYGSPLPPLVAARLDRELKAILGNKFAVLYEIARQLVAESNKRGYSVGSRGSVGSSLAAYLLKISEVNPLPAHQRCKACFYSEFDENQRLSGIDIPAKACPKCGAGMINDGHNIPFETFVGFKGDKVPDIDLNFAPEVQGEIQKYAEQLFGEGKAFKAGTISTLAEKTAFGYVKKYYEAKGERKRGVEIERVKAGLEGVKRTSGQHPGGVILVRHDKDITDFTPVQYPGDGKDLGGKEGKNEGTLLTTHFDYHAIDENLVKLDILGKDDGSAFKHLAELSGVAELDVPLNDAKALAIFASSAA